MLGWVCKLTGHWLVRSRWVRTPEGWERVAHCRLCWYHEQQEVVGWERPLDVWSSRGSG